jgi:hypothetical protein
MTGAGGIERPVKLKAMKCGPAYGHGKRAASSTLKPKRG